MFLHTSPKALYSTINDPDNTNLPKCLRTGTPCEVNVSAAFSTFTISKYNRLEDPMALPIGAQFRFYHSQVGRSVRL